MQLQAALGSAPTADPRNPPLSKKPGPGKSGSERKAKWPRKQGHKPRTSELFLGRRSGAERGQVPTEGGTGALEDTATKPLEPRWKKSKWQNTEEKRKKKARPPNPTPTEGIGFWAAICCVGLWMDEKR